MKKTLLALALLAFTGTTAFAHDKDGHDKDGKKGKKESCSMKGSTAGGHSCCMKGGKTAAVKPAAAPAAAKL